MIYTMEEWAVMSAIACEICGRGPAEGVDVFRVNAKGVPGVWRCKAHAVSRRLRKRRRPG